MEKYLKDDTKTFLEEKQPQAPIIRTKVNRSSELRERLRTRLIKCREKRIEKQKSNTSTIGNNSNLPKLIKPKIESRVPLPTNMPPPASTPSEVSEVAKEMTDIRGLLNYIEGNSAISKADLAKKKAAKKNRQREKKEQERLEAELEAKRKAEEEKRKEKERLKELEKQEKVKKQKEKEMVKQLKKKLKKQRQQAKKLEEVEETIPAMVTIKRVPNSETGSPSVTITLKGYTPDQDKLLYTLVDKPDEKENTPVASNENKSNVPESNKSKKKKKKMKETIKTPPVEEPPKVLTKEVKVTLAVDNNPNTILPEPAILASNLTKNKTVYKCCNHNSVPLDEEIRTFGNLRLPPGITITKVQNPAAVKKYLGSDAPIKSQQGVIVVDTEKLGKKSVNGSENDVKTKRKRRKKNKKTESNETNSELNTPRMVTLKNPMFQQYTQALNKPEPMISEPTGAASIITNENGMVTIRSSRLQQSLDQGLPARPLGFPLPMAVQEIASLPVAINSTVKENLPSPPVEDMVATVATGKTETASVQTESISEIINGIGSISINNSPSPKSCSSPEPVITKSTNEDETIQNSLDAQQILSGLPGIEITKVDRNSKKEEEKVPEEAQVTIISSSGKFDFDFGKDDDDWIYETVFKPRDVLEEELDDDELELEEFKRFCQQSVPPKCKEKVSLNVADIVLKKKTDVNFS